MAVMVGRWGGVAFLALSVGVAGNMLLFQSPVREARARTPQEPVIGQTMRVEAPVRAARQTPNAAQPKTAVESGKPVTAPRTRDAEPPQNLDLVRAIQRELTQRGYEAGGDDGVLNLVSRAAIMAFEHDQGLPLTAEPSEVLLRMLVMGGGEPRATKAQPASISAERRAQVDQIIRTVQQSLGAIGYYTAKPDGRTTPETERAIREFEMDQGLIPTGRISGALVQRLARIAASGKLVSGR